MLRFTTLEVIHVTRLGGFVPYIRPVFTSCSDSPLQTSEASDTLVVALSGEPTNLNPIFGDLYGSIYGDHWPIFSSLLDYDQKLELVPDLAVGLPRSAQTAAP